jgi:hypothetical protein
MRIATDTVPVRKRRSQMCTFLTVHVRNSYPGNVQEIPISCRLLVNSRLPVSPPEHLFCLQDGLLTVFNQICRGTLC